MTVHKRRRRQQRQKKPGRADPALGREGEVEIESVGRNGDGIAQLDGLRVFVPQALPGDRLHVRLIAKRADGYTTEVVERQKTTERAEPACPHFGRCGGCQLQHLPADDYRWVLESPADRNSARQPRFCQCRHPPPHREQASLPTPAPPGLPAGRWPEACRGSAIRRGLPAPWISSAAKP